MWSIMNVIDKHNMSPDLELYTEYIRLEECKVRYHKLLKNSKKCSFEFHKFKCSLRILLSILTMKAGLRLLLKQEKT
jgi:hypothetical protein